MTDTTMRRSDTTMTRGDTTMTRGDDITPTRSDTTPTHWARAKSAAWESLVIASIVSGAFFVFFDPRLRGAQDPVPGWLSNWPATYASGLLICWLLTALILKANDMLRPSSRRHG